MVEGGREEGWGGEEEVKCKAPRYSLQIHYTNMQVIATVLLIIPILHAH